MPKVTLDLEDGPESTVLVTVTCGEVVEGSGAQVIAAQLLALLVQICPSVVIRRSDS